MMQRNTIAPFAASILATCLSTVSSAQTITPTVSNWKLNLTGQTGYSGILADVQQVLHSTNFVYVKSTNIPSYTIGPWPGNPNTPSNQNWTFKFPKTVTYTATGTVVGLGQIGVLANGVVFFNALDAMSYNNQNIWHQSAVFFEAASFDSCKGHPAPNRAYHPHQLASCVAANDPTKHSMILGWGFDGVPIYGSYGYSAVDGTGGIRRMQSGYQKRAITQRTTLPNGSALPPNQYGPAVSATYPLGCYAEDYVLVMKGADLDATNARFCVTPEFPNGTWAYFATIDSALAPAYPFLIGANYRGVVTAGNTGPTGGHVVISEATINFTSTPCLADLNGDRVVDAADLASLLSRWGFGGGLGDLDRSGDVGGGDLAILLNSWGNC